MSKPAFTIRPYKSTARPHLKYVVRGKIQGHPRVRKFFESKAEAETFARIRNQELMNQGAAHVAFPDWLRVMAQRCNERLSAIGKTLDDATDAFIAQFSINRVSIPLAQLFDECEAAKRKAGLSDNYCRRFRYLKTRFAAAFPGKLASEITRKDVSGWLTNGLDGLSPKSKNHQRIALMTAFKYAIDREYVRENPVIGTETFKLVQHEIGILTPEQLTKLLSVADPRVLPALAINAFAGIRVAEVARLEWKDIDLDGGYITVRAVHAKSAQRRIVKIQPCLDAWLRPFVKSSGKVITSWKTFDMLKRKSHRAAGLNWQQNAPRHSFASYHLAMFKNAAELALEMGHRHTGLIFAHYREVVRPGEAAKYFAITPQAMLKAGIEIAAFTPQAYHWYREPSLQQWNNGEYWVVYLHDRHRNRKLFKKQSDAQALCDQLNARDLATELKREALEITPNVVQMFGASGAPAAAAAAAS
jgi:integrase